VNVSEILNRFFNLLKGTGGGQIKRKCRQYDVLYETVSLFEIVMHF